MNTSIKGNLVDVHLRKIFPAEILIKDGKIHQIQQLKHKVSSFILPGFIDAHIHIESTLLTPESFAQIALSHGTIATVSDPHEIANVCGLDGVNFMVKSGEKTSLNFFWAAPSCVPATPFETSGAILNSGELEELFKSHKIVALGEMMNYPGVISKEKSVIAKCQIAKNYSRVIDGHAPGVSGNELAAYVSAGISTDHECSALDEALEKINLGMKILVREGSSAKNFEALFSLFITHPDSVMLCSDDLHVDNLIEGHINLLIKRAVAKNIPLFNILRAVSLNPVNHYKLPVGLLREGDSADFVVVDSLEGFNVKSTWIKGMEVFNTNRKKEIVSSSCEVINHFKASEISKEELGFQKTGSKMKIIEVTDGSLTTNSAVLNIDCDLDDFLRKNSILKLYVKDRYNDINLGKAFVRGFGPMKGAIASTIAHDSHNIIAIGDSIDTIQTAINLLVECKGGISFVSYSIREVLALPIGGLMTNDNAETTAEKYGRIIKHAHDQGCVLDSPLMTLSFLALLVIPSLKLSDKGLFDVNTFSFTDLFTD